MCQSATLPIPGSIQTIHSSNSTPTHQTNHQTTQDNSNRTSHKLTNKTTPKHAIPSAPEESNLITSVHSSPSSPINSKPLSAEHSIPPVAVATLNNSTSVLPKNQTPTTKASHKCTSSLAAKPDSSRPETSKPLSLPKSRSRITSSLFKSVSSKLITSTSSMNGTPEETFSAESEKMDASNLTSPECHTELDTEDIDFNNDDELCSMNDNSIIDESKKVDNETVNASSNDDKKAVNDKIEFVIFKIQRKPTKFKCFEILQFSKKYFVENSCVVFVQGLEGTNFDIHAWKNFHEVMVRG